MVGGHPIFARPVQETEPQYKIVFKSPNEGEQAYWEISKWLDGEFISLSKTTLVSCSCEQWQRRRVQCRHMKMVKYWELRGRPNVLLRISGANNIFEDEYQQMLN